MSSSPPYKHHHSVRPFLLALLFIALGLAYVILQPFLHSIILAIVVAGVFHPFYRRALSWCGNRPNTAATLTLVSIVFAIVLPLSFIIVAMIEQGIQLTRTIQIWATANTLHELQNHIRVLSAMAWLKEKAPFIEIKHINFQGHLVELTRSLSERLLHHSAQLLGITADIIIHFTTTIIIVYFLLRDGQTILATIKQISPLRTSQEDRIVDKIRTVSRSVLLGSLITMFSEGVAGGIGLIIVGLPALFWGSMMAFASLIPIIGTALIWIPAVGYLCLVGHWGQAIFLFLWCAIIVTSIDNFLRPVFMQGKTGLSTFYILLAILGGVQTFGLLGILYGPLILTFAMVMLAIYNEEFQDVLIENTSAAALRNG
ncbi:Predicted PurR-regulated permease PerM [Desulfovibrionales bacterium]